MVKLLIIPCGMLLFSNHAISFSLQSHTPLHVSRCTSPFKGGTCPCTQKGFEYCTPKMKAKIRIRSVIPVPYANDGMLSHRF